MSLRTAYIGTRVLETSENYALADAPLAVPSEVRPSARRLPLFDDERFWRQILADPDGYWGAEFHTKFPIAISEWVARVPGLFWKPEAEQFRELQGAMVEYVGKWQAWEPIGKSAKVLGGLGTLHLPPTDDGKRLVSLSVGLNASAGIPALVFPEVWEKISAGGPSEGRLLSVRRDTRWQPMATGWSVQFQATRDVPRGYLILSKPDAVDVLDVVAPILIHPFSVMEYREGAKELFAYVYATGDTSKPNYRGYIEQFFSAYAQAKDRYGRYLLASDMVSPLWDAVYDGPADLRRADPSSESQLALVEARVREHMLGGDTIDRVLEALGRLERFPVDLQRVSDDIGIVPAVWFRGGTPAEAASQLVDEAQRQRKFAALIEVLAKLFPTLISN